MTTAIPWSRAKCNLLRAIAAANAGNRIFEVVPFDEQAVRDMALEGFLEIGIRGPVVTVQGERRLRAES